MIDTYMSKLSEFPSKSTFQIRPRHIIDLSESIILFLRKSIFFGYRYRPLSIIKQLHKTGSKRKWTKGRGGT